MINVKRTIIPVGQGLFCKETFCKGEQPCLNVIYDCGGFKPSTRLLLRQYQNHIGAQFVPEKNLPKPQCKDDVLNQRIIQALPNNAIVDVAFISHFHYDHISGLVALANNNIPIRKLMMPQLSRELLVEAIVYNYIQADLYQDDKESINTVNEFLLSLFFHNQPITDTTIVIVPYQDHDEGITYRIGIGDSMNPILDSSGSSKWIWEYVPYCIKDQEFANDLYEAILGDKKYQQYLTNLDEAGIRGFIKEISTKSGIKHIKSIYNKCAEKNHNQNEYSMPVYSGPLVPVSQVKTEYCNKHSNSRNNRNCASCIKTAGCLYTGDFNASKYIYGLHKYLSMDNRWDKIGVVQVPHHGALSSHSTALYNKCRYGVISAGKLNQYHHPNWDVCDDIVTNGLDCIVVNEFASTAFNQIITINI